MILTLVTRCVDTRVRAERVFNVDGVRLYVHVYRLLR